MEDRLTVNSLTIDVLDVGFVCKNDTATGIEDICAKQLPFRVSSRQHDENVFKLTENTTRSRCALG
eukprot:jgi/Phyca11/504996/fgenesh2_kg.PHYCAscaffold_10_\